MELSNYARIGKGVITKAIGLQENYIDVFEAAESKLDEEKSGCAGCPVCSTKCQMRDLGVDEAVIQLKSLEAFMKAADGQATKIIIPSEIQKLAGLVTSAVELAKDQ